MKRFILLFTFFTFTFTFLTAQVPRYITHQGFLTNSAGVPYDTTLSMSFGIYSSITGGTALYSQTLDNVQVRKGVFNVSLGPISSPFDNQYYLEITVASETFTPRTQLTSVPYSLRADTAEYAKNAIGSGNPTLPFPGTVNTDTPPITVLQNGIGGGINVQIDNANNGSRALNVATNGGNDAIYSYTIGTASAGNFAINNVNNEYGAAVLATSNGSHALFSRNDGNGSAGDFMVTSPSSNSTVLNIANQGLGQLANFSGLNNLSKGVNIEMNSTTDKPHLTLHELDNDYARLSFQNGFTEGYWTIAGLTNTTASNSRLNFYSSQLGADAMSITGLGRVGINTPSPTARMEITDNANDANLRITGSGTYGAQLELKATETGSKRWWVSSVGTAGGTRQGNLEFIQSSDALIPMAITKTGDVGIGTTNPLYKLHVNGTVNAASFLQNGYPLNSSQWTTTASNIYYNAGNVGIGTSNPATKLHISDATNPAAFTLGVNSTSGGYTALLGSLSSVSNGYASLQAVQSAGNSFGNLVLNKDGGNVGIGTTPNANYKLDVNGTLNANNVMKSGVPMQSDMFHNIVLLTRDYSPIQYVNQYSTELPLSDLDYTVTLSDSAVVLLHYSADVRSATTFFGAEGFIGVKYDNGLMQDFIHMYPFFIANAAYTFSLAPSTFSKTISHRFGPGNHTINALLILSSRDTQHPNSGLGITHAEVTIEVINK
jgi:hypothetical protein